MLLTKEVDWQAKLLELTDELNASKLEVENLKKENSELAKKREELLEANSRLFTKLSLEKLEPEEEKPIQSRVDLTSIESLIERGVIKKWVQYLILQQFLLKH